MRIDKRLNLVIPVYKDDDSNDVKAYVHSAPISAEVFDLYYQPLARTHTKIFGGGFSALSGPKIADKLLRDISKEMGIWEDVEKGLVGEMRRLTNVMVPGEKGWQSMPLDDAVKAGTFERDEVQEVEAAITFFTVVSAILPRRESRQMLAFATSLWGARVESLNSTEYRNGLKIATETANSGESQKAG